MTPFQLKSTRHPGPICGNCLSMESEWVSMSGRGTLYAWTVVHQRYHPGFAEEIPYTVALVELEEGPRSLTQIVDFPNNQLYVGMAVDVVFDDVTEEIALPKSEPAS